MHSLLSPRAHGAVYQKCLQFIDTFNGNGQAGETFGGPEEEGGWPPRVLRIWSSLTGLKCILLMPVYIFLYK